MIIIQYRPPYIGGEEYLIAHTDNTRAIELAITKAKERIADLGVAAYEQRAKEEAEGIRHDPGRRIDGFPHWEKIYKEELFNVGIDATTQDNILIYQTYPFDEFDKRMKT
jgi:hypothetical protein